jgi:UDP-glucose 4-epimerase
LNLSTNDTQGFPFPDVERKQTVVATLRGANAVITGGAGFIGSHIADSVLAAGAARVTIIDDLGRGSLDNLRDSIATGRVKVIVGDISDESLLDAAMSDADVVFHQAALRITQCAAEPLLGVRTMVNGTQAVLDAAVRHGVKKVAAASSASVYGEPSYLPMDEAHPFNNRTLYGAAKIANEQLLRAYAEMYGLHYVALRPFNVYGPRMDRHGIYTEVMIRWLDRLARNEPLIIFGNGRQTMDFVYVTDVAQAYVLAITSDADDEVFNVGSGTETSLLELSELLYEETGRLGMEPIFEPARSVNGVTRRLASTEFARRRIGFQAQVGLREGIHELTEWHLNATHAEARVA